MATAISLRLRVNNNSRAIQSHRFVKLLSSSSSSSSSTSSNPKVEDENTTQSSSSSPSSNSSVSSFLRDVRARLKQEPPQQQQQRQPHSPLYTRLSTEKPSSPTPNFQTIRENLSEFRSRTAVPLSQRREKPSSPDISFQELYKRNVIPQDKESSNSVFKGGISFGAIRDKLKNQSNQTATDGGGAMSFPKFSGGGGLKFRPSDPNQREPVKWIGGEQNNLPASVFGKEISKKSAEELPNNMEKMKHVKMYNKKELGERLRGLRTEDAKGFSLGELNERLIKLRELEQKEPSILPGALDDIREGLYTMQQKDENPNKSYWHRLEVMSQIGGTPQFMLSPPKEHLVETYFHPDNMSSAEKMKLELKRVRDEFKMSESDCGSSRVQVALLTTKIKHLSTALHKKDKHSRKGLQAMVQKRKKLLKYMRRTDWDSYCLVLSKLGLRDNPDYKN